jgi:hypothetical protein
MSRARRGEQPRIPLFTFLDVLICTMGALIVLLSLLIGRAKQHAFTEQEEQAAASQAELDPEELKRRTEQQEDLQWRADVLKQQREEFARDLANKRLELAHLEDHIRRLEDQAKKLMAEAEELKRLNSNKLADRDSAKQQLDEMEKEIAAKKDELDKARKEALRRRPAYAIVPYDGPNGTSRRPMYIECTEQGIILQPEGVKLSAKDFQGPMGPGNPLDAALRAIREHWKQHGLQGEPYPLIVVRPDGAIAFGAARSAMKHWESEFGYELVDQDAELKFPPADRQLADTLQRAIQDARQRQFALAAAMPKRFGAEGQLASFRAVDNIDPDQFAEDTGGPGAGTGRSGTGRGVPSFGNGGKGMGTGPNGATGSGGSGTSGVANSYGSAPPNSLRSPDRAGTSGRYASNGQRAGGTGPAGSYGEPGGTSSAAAGETASGRPGTSSTSGAANGSNSTGGSSTPSGAAGGTGGTASRGSASGQPGGTSSSTGSGSSVSGSGGGASSGSSQSNSVSMQAGSPPSLEVSPQQKKARKAIKSGGENWGLPNSAGKAVGVSRPIRMECHENRLLLLPEQGDGRTPLVVPIEGDLSQNLDAVIAAVWQRMDRWGLAVSNGYWKPILTIDVKPGGEECFWELQQLLRGSGIEVEKKAP